MSGHTPGPWIQGFWSGRCFLKHQHGNGDCDYKPEFYSTTTDVSQAKENGKFIVGSCDDGYSLSEADARLIAAAPDLLAHLKDAARDFSIMRMGHRMERWDAAIAKAEGR